MYECPVPGMTVSVVAKSRFGQIYSGVYRVDGTRGVVSVGLNSLSFGPLESEHT